MLYPGSRHRTGMAMAWAFGVIATLLASEGPEKSAPPAPESSALLITDADGQLVTITQPRFTVGVRRLGWLADPNAATEDGKKGPWAFELREPDSTTFQKGVLTLIPLASIEAIDYDYKQLTAKVLIKGLPTPVIGTTRYKGFCFLGVEGLSGGKKVQLLGGELSKAKSAIRTGFQSIRFPHAQPLPPRSTDSRTWRIYLEAAKADDKPQTVRQVKALYQLANGQERLVSGLRVRNGQPIMLDADPAVASKMDVVAVDPNKNTLVLAVDAPDRLVVIPTHQLEDQPARLLGLVGEVEAGWKFFPLHTIARMEIDSQSTTGKPQ